MLENPGHIPLELIEIQSGNYLGKTISRVFKIAMVETEWAKKESGCGRVDEPLPGI